MTDKSIDLDQHRGSAAQKASDPSHFVAIKPCTGLAYLHH